MDVALMASGPIDSVLSHCFFGGHNMVFYVEQILFECSVPSSVTVV